MACGAVNDSGDKPTPIDAALSPDDAALPIDDAAPGPDADLSGNATVHTKAAVAGQVLNAAIADVDVISNLPNGNVLATGKTDAAGSATIKVYPGGAVTALYHHSGTNTGADLFTFVGVAPGDTLEFGQKVIPFTGTNTNLGSQTYTWPASPNAGVTNYRVQTSCTSTSVAAPGTSSLALAEFAACNRNPMRILYTTTTSNPTTLVNCGVRTTAFGSGDTVALGAWSNAVAGSGNLTGLPASVTSSSVSLSAVVGGTIELMLLGGGSAGGAPTGGAFTGNFPWCPNLGERTVARVNLARPGFGSIVVMDSLPATAASVTVASPMLPPWVEFTALASAYRRSVAWVLANEGASAHDAVYLALGYLQRVNNISSFGEWHIMMPPNTQSIDLPKLPTALDAFAPQVDDFGLQVFSLVAIEVPTISNYDGLRALGIGFAICPDCAIRANEVPRVITSGFVF